MVFKKKPKVLEPKPVEVKKEKAEVHCIIDGCYELKSPGQTYFCTAHIRRN